ncbi:3-oxoacyl-(acyl carrier protein) synthase [Caballeronia telluris]|uniref:3-oxoacyl-(Acyl carrier protein) synthase n=2 Tax=Caballeronia telluris TaxID=326475 RepID=A0A158FVT9_9BURK|nr:3-oxoacyl-(acyl carrier protein) synthase [Caballeronia telluris]
MAHQVQLEKPWRGRTKLAKMAAMAIEECLEGVEKSEWKTIPLLLCVAEKERPGRLEGLDDYLLDEIQTELATRFNSDSAVIAQGRVAGMTALSVAQRLIETRACAHALIAGVDSLLAWSTLSTYEIQDRLFSRHNSNGFMPGEAGAALLVSASEKSGDLSCIGIGFGTEACTIGKSEPLRGDGLTRAVQAALAAGGCEMHQLDLRVSDISGEQYYFKEAALVVARLLRIHKDEFDLWNPAECIGEVGAATGLALVTSVHAACGKRYTRGRLFLLHAANDAGGRAAMLLKFEAAT